MVKYSKNSGSSIEDAIIITDVKDHSSGIGAEYEYLMKKFGKGGLKMKMWQLGRQYLVKEGDKKYDILTVIFRDGNKKEFYFDITDFYTE